MTQEQLKKVGWLLIILGAVMPVMMAAIKSFDYRSNVFDFWYTHLIVLGTGYFLSLKGKGYTPFKSRHLYIMIVFSPLPIIGPVLATIRLTHLSKCGEQLDPARQGRAMLLSVASVIVIVIVPAFLLCWLQDKAMKQRMEFSKLLTNAQNHTLQAEFLKKEGKDFSVEIARARTDLQRIRQLPFDINEDREGHIAIVYGDTFCLQSRYDEAEKMYKDAKAKRSIHAKERLAKLKELKKEP